ncbi:zinc-binding dehydrogenase [Chitinophaga filiformis]|uniref:Zinc-binding dehydrogenase n=1 Tax=Chitinophaga filiformis TaxID=104663 RepID=A0ABY4I707_CHIFI|nr:zinc-binding dehydrogenase [Chitinophaga filiformis]UPK71657.1 zinc-binding dehydrogenase [Chitinophaga filiformis]
MSESTNIISNQVNHRVAIKNPGKYAELSIIKEQILSPKIGEVLVRVEYCGVAMGDILFRKGISPGKFPMVPGYDIVGIIISTGEGVVNFKKGDRVAGLTLTGGYTTYITLPVTELILLPSSIKPEAAAASVLNYTTAYQLLVNVAKLKKGDSVLIHGAGGGIGLAVLQLCKYLGIEAYGTVSAKKINAVKQEGATAIDYQSNDFVEFIRKRKANIDAVLDPIGGSQLFRSFKVVRSGGTLVSFGIGSAINGNGSPFWKLIKAMLPLLLLKLSFQKKHVKLYVTTSRTKALREVLQEIIILLANEKIAPPIAKIFMLNEAEEAHQYLLNERPAGKILLKP